MSGVDCRVVRPRHCALFSLEDKRRSPFATSDVASFDCSIDAW